MKTPIQMFPSHKLSVHSRDFSFHLKSSFQAFHLGMSDFSCALGTSSSRRVSQSLTKTLTIISSAKSRTMAHHPTDMEGSIYLLPILTNRLYDPLVYAEDPVDPLIPLICKGYQLLRQLGNGRYGRSITDRDTVKDALRELTSFQIL